MTIADGFYFGIGVYLSVLCGLGIAVIFVALLEAFANAFRKW